MDKWLKVLNELKNSEDYALKEIMLFAMLCGVIDISHLVYNFNFPQWIRTFYFMLFVLCFYVSRNRYHRKRRLRQELIENLSHICGKDYELLYKFASTGWGSFELNDMELLEAAYRINKIYGILKIENNTVYMDAEMIKIVRSALFGEPKKKSYWI